MSDQKLEAELRAELELGCSDTCIHLFVSPGSGCTWADHWYSDVARKMKSQFCSRLRCSLQWQADFEAIDQSANRNNWKAVLLQSQLLFAAPSHSAAILLGHSSGGNAALEVAERNTMDALIVIGAGYSQRDRRCGHIQPWDYDAIVANVTRRIVVLHGAEDQVIHNTEAQTIAKGLHDAVARAGSACVPQLDIRIHEAGVGHGMQRLCPAVLLEVLRALILELSEDTVGS